MSEIFALSYQRNKERQIGSLSAYNSKHMTEADEAWRTMFTGHGIISFPESYATEHKMIETLRYSVESPEAEKSRVYLVEACHAMHCLVSFKPARESKIGWDALRDWTEEHTSSYYDQYDMEPGTIGDNLRHNYHAGDGLPAGSL
ncbi:uncharacterized protein Bfra_000558 [Botrytis fragariae]|uniref:Uncharacterized protein n=1 Tax=Botrytis fragariae TaxID=1964551 RepID=A0A8H6B2P9_9HELO|nr:uncharacterized protein Bfra_000558 [Botrytis fragariae]KAF5878393.1 hypothetical protein Bfra_000558 [Botrytis fragariae]